MSDQITVTGLVATPPNHVVTSTGLAVTNFRLASTQRRYDRAAGAWVDGATNWFTVTAFRRLADHVAASVQKGERVIVTGRLRVRDWESGERSGTAVEIEAESLGHDLLWGTTTFRRAVSTSARSDEHASASDAPESTAESAGGEEWSPAPPAEGDDELPAAEAPLAGAVPTPF